MRRRPSRAHARRPRAGTHHLLHGGKPTLRFATAAQMRVMLDRLPAMIGYWDRALRNRMANAAFVDFYGLRPEELYGKHMRELLGTDVYLANRGFADGALAGKEQHFERTIPDPTGRLRHTQVSYVPDTLNGHTRGFFVLVTDITAQKHHQHALERLATHDALTGLMNHRGLFEALDHECSRVDRYQQPCALLLIDLDHFKALNDEFGHAAGDGALVQVGHILRHRLRESDLVARQGGDEFAVILIGVDHSEANGVARDICERIAGAQIGRPDRPITASVGLAEIEPGDTAARIVSRADSWMYEAKRRGGNNVVAVRARTPLHFQPEGLVSSAPPR